MKEGNKLTIIIGTKSYHNILNHLLIGILIVAFVKVGNRNESDVHRHLVKYVICFIPFGSSSATVRVPLVSMNRH